MRRQTKGDITEVLLAVYGVPGQYFFGALILIALWKATKHISDWAVLFLILGVIFSVLEIITPVMAGKRLLTKIKYNLKRMFKK